VGLARAKLRDMPGRAADEEDVALSAFASFCRGVERGRFPHLNDRENLWHLLVLITSRKSAHHRRDGNRLKRGGGRPCDGEMDQLLSEEPTPEFAAEVAEECRRLLDVLADARLEAVALWKMEGHTNEEIAALLGCAPRTVERK